MRAGHPVAAAPDFAPETFLVALAHASSPYLELRPIVSESGPHRRGIPGFAAAGLAGFESSENPGNGLNSVTPGLHSGDSSDLDLADIPNKNLVFVGAFTEQDDRPLEHDQQGLPRSVQVTGQSEPPGNHPSSITKSGSRRDGSERSRELRDPSDNRPDEEDQTEKHNESATQDFPIAFE